MNTLDELIQEYQQSIAVMKTQDIPGADLIVGNLVYHLNKLLDMRNDWNSFTEETATLTKQVDRNTQEVISYERELGQ